MFTPIDDANYEATLQGCEAGVALFYKKLCPHCKNMEKVLEKFASLAAGVSLFSMDIEENPAAAQVFVHSGPYHLGNQKRQGEREKSRTHESQGNARLL